MVIPHARPQCEIIRVFAFRGDRSDSYRNWIVQKARDEEDGGEAVTRSEGLMWAGHAGLSLDLGGMIYGFNPQQGSLTTQGLANILMNDGAVPGVVLDDTFIFADARRHTLDVLEFDVRMPPVQFHRIETELARERNSSNYTYGYPDGDGDCNCVTWIERLGVPLLTGRMDEVTYVIERSIHDLGLPVRRFGDCG